MLDPVKLLNFNYRSSRISIRRVKDLWRHVRWICKLCTWRRCIGAVEVQSYSFLTSTQKELNGQLHAPRDLPSGNLPWRFGVAGSRSWAHWTGSKYLACVGNRTPFPM